MTQYSTATVDKKSSNKSVRQWQEEIRKKHIYLLNVLEDSITTTQWVPHNDLNNISSLSAASYQGRPQTFLKS